MFLPREWCSKGKAHMRKSMGLGSTGQERLIFPISYQFCPKILKYMSGHIAIVIISDKWLWVQTERFSQGEPYAILQRLRQINSLRRLSRSGCDDTLVREMSTKQSRKNDDLKCQKFVSSPLFSGWLSKSLWQVHVVRWLWVSLEPAKLWQRVDHTWKHHLVLWSLSECWLLGDHHPSYHKRYG